MSFLIPHGWRARLYHLSRHPGHLALATIGILVTGAMVAFLIVMRAPAPVSEGQALRHYFDRGLAEGLKNAPHSTPRALAEWLHDLTTGLPTLAERLNQPAPSIDSYGKTGRLLGIKVEPAIQKHAGPLDQQAIFRDYVVGGSTRRRRGVRTPGSALKPPPCVCRPPPWRMNSWATCWKGRT